MSTWILRTSNWELKSQFFTYKRGPKYHNRDNEIETSKPSLKIETSKPRHQIRNLKTELETKTSKLRPRSLDLKTDTLKTRPQNQDLETETSKPRFRNWDLETETSEPRPQNWKFKTEKSKNTEVTKIKIIALLETNKPVSKIKLQDLKLSFTINSLFCQCWENQSKIELQTFSDVEIAGRWKKASSNACTTMYRSDLSTVICTLQLQPQVQVYNVTESWETCCSYVSFPYMSESAWVLCEHH